MNSKHSLYREIFAFSGKSRAGKTTAANLFYKYNGCAIVSFANALKAKAMDDFDLSKAQVFTANKDTIDERYNVTPRNILISMGNFYRSFDPLFWVKLAFKSINELPDTVVSVVIDDCRFIDEANYIREAGGTIIRINRNDSGVVDEKLSKDISEVGLDGYAFEHYIDNNGDIAKFNTDLRDIIHSIRKRKELNVI